MNITYIRLNEQMNAIYEEYIRVLIDEASKSTMNRHFAAILIYRQRIISRGHNRYIDFVNSYLSKKDMKKISIHAEQDCINKCRYKHLIPKSTLMLIRLSNTDLIRVEPCHTCADIIDKYGIRRVIILYTLDS